MARYCWNETAGGLAQQVHQTYAHVERGVVPLRFLDESVTPPRFIEDGPLVVGVFGNDNFSGEDRTRFEVDLVRSRLLDLGGKEVGFGLTPDGRSWAMLVEVMATPCHTRPGRTLQKELLRVSLDHALWCAWRKVNGLPPDTCLEEDLVKATPATKARA
jgi:hypothetical protein